MENFKYCKNDCGRIIDKKYNEYFDRDCEQFRDICCRKCRGKNTSHTDKCYALLVNDIKQIINNDRDNLLLFDIESNQITVINENFDTISYYGNIITYDSIKEKGIKYFIEKIQEIKQNNFEQSLHKSKDGDFEEKKEDEVNDKIITVINFETDNYDNKIIQLYILYKDNNLKLKNIFEIHRSLGYEISDVKNINNEFNIDLINFINTNNFKVKKYFGRRYSERIVDYDEHEIKTKFNCLYGNDEEKKNIDIALIPEDLLENIEKDKDGNITKGDIVYDQNNTTHRYKTFNFGYSWIMSLLINKEYIDSFNIDLSTKDDIVYNEIIKSSIDEIKSNPFITDENKELAIKNKQDNNFNYYYNKFMRIINDDIKNIKNKKIELNDLHKEFLEDIKNLSKFKSLTKIQKEQIINIQQGGNRDNYYNKYLKYKNKYLKLKNKTYLF